MNGSNKRIFVDINSFEPNDIENIENITPKSRHSSGFRWKKTLKRKNSSSSPVIPQKRICIDLTNDESQCLNIFLLKDILNESYDATKVDMDSSLSRLREPKPVSIFPSSTTSLTRSKSDLSGGLFYFKCPLCSEEMSNLKYVSHVIQHFSLDSLDLGNVSVLTKCFKCLKCVHSNATHMCSKSLTWSSRRISCVTHECPICYEFCTNDKGKLASHFTVHEHENALLCSYCHQIFVYPLTSRSTTLGKKTFTTITSTTDFIEHIYNHIVNPSTICIGCDLSFFDKDAFKVHIFLKHLRRKSLVSRNCGISSEAKSLRLILPQFTFIFHPSMSYLMPRFDYNLLCSECCHSLTAMSVEHFKTTFRCEYCNFRSNCFVHACGHWFVQHGDIEQLKSYSFPAHLKKRIEDLAVTLKARERALSCSSYLMHCGCGFKSIRSDHVMKHLLAAKCGFTSVTCVERNHETVSVRCRQRVSSKIHGVKNDLFASMGILLKSLCI